MKVFRCSVLRVVLVGIIFSGLSCVSQDIFSKVDPEVGRYSARLVTFSDTNPALGVLSGTIDVVNALDESKVTDYRLYWGSGPATKLSGMIEGTPKTGAPVAFTLSNRTIPTAATYLLVYSYNAAEGELKYPTACVIIDLTDIGIYVDGALGVDAIGNGTRTNPVATIQFGIARAAAEGYQAVHVAEGTYLIDGDIDPIILSEGISLYGGYQSVTWTRDLGLYASILEDNSTTEGTTGVGNPNRCIAAVGNLITNATTVNGFYINGNTLVGRAYTAGINCLNGASPFIVNCTINGGNALTRSSGIFTSNGSAPLIRSSTIDGGNAPEVRGIHNNTSAPIIAWNTINGGAGTNSAGIYNINSTPEINGNVIDAGNGTNQVYGIYNDSSAGIIRYNTVRGGFSAVNSYGIYNLDSGAVTIRQNDINGQGNPSGGPLNTYGIYNTNTSGTILNNTIHGGDLPGGGTLCVGIYSDLNSSPLIENNIINAGGNGATISRGIDLTNSLGTRIFNNRIDGGSGLSLSTAVRLNTSDNVLIINNILIGGNADDSTGIWLNMNSNNVAIFNNSIQSGHAAAVNAYSVRISTGCNNTRIINNIIYTVGAGSRYGVYEGAAINPAQLTNNNIFDCPTALYFDNANGPLVDILDVNDLAMTGSPISQDNVSFVLSLNADLRIISVFPTVVTQGGLDLTPEPIFPLNPAGNRCDRDLAIRTAPWSMGAYEY